MLKATTVTQPNSIQIFTDGSKLGTESLGLCGIAESIGLPEHCSSFQAEVLAIQAAVKIIWDENVINRNIAILSDSQAVIRALGCTVGEI